MQYESVFDGVSAECRLGDGFPEDAFFGDGFPSGVFSAENGGPAAERLMLTPHRIRNSAKRRLSILKFMRASEAFSGPASFIPIKISSFYGKPKRRRGKDLPGYFSIKTGKFLKISEYFGPVKDHALDFFPIMKRTGGEHEHSLFQDQ